MPVKRKLTWFDFFVILFSLIGVVIVSISFSAPIKETTFVPNAVTGLTTMSGILTAFIGLRFSQIKFYDKKTLDFLKNRIRIMTLSVIFGLFFVMIGLSMLVFGNLQFSFQTAVFGTTLITIVLCLTMVITFDTIFRIEK